MKTISMLFTTLIISFLVNNLAVASDTKLTWGEVAKDSTKKVLLMHQDEALEYCKNLNKRLPTIREFAQFSTTLGSGGIQETIYADVPAENSAVKAEIQQNSSKLYVPIFKLNSSHQTVVDFYFNRYGYNSPSAEISKYWFWSSSVDPSDAENLIQVFTGSSAFITSLPSWTNIVEVATMCIAENSVFLPH